MTKWLAGLIQWTLLTVGIVCFGAAGSYWFASYRYEQAQAAAFARGEADASNHPMRGTLLGLLSVPRLGLSTAVIEGDDPESLEFSAGHLSDTPPPWENGNSAIAAHRDGRFRVLRKIKVGDEIRVRTSRGELRYEVRELSIVEPEDLSVLATHEPASLTLITCYPFTYIGRAPKRFVVRAERVSRPVRPEA